MWPSNVATIGGTIEGAYLKPQTAAAMNSSYWTTFTVNQVSKMPPDQRRLPDNFYVRAHAVLRENNSATSADLELPAVRGGMAGLVAPGAESEPVLGAVVAADVAGARLLGRRPALPTARGARPRSRHLHLVLAAVEVHAVSPAPEIR